MERFYVESASLTGVIPVATLAETAESSVGDAAERFHNQYVARYATWLSPHINEDFVKVENWESDVEIIPSEEFFCIIRKLLKEGRLIADRQWRDRFYTSISPKAEYDETTPAEMVHLMQCYPLPPEEGEGYELYKSEMLMFMAIIIREGIARRLKELVQTN